VDDEIGQAYADAIGAVRAVEHQYPVRHGNAAPLPD
jgi:hypothetical protein